VSLNPSFEELLARQLQMTRLTWQALVGHGYTPGRLVRLDFCYHAPSGHSAAALQRFLNEGTDYDVTLASDGPFYRRRWTVTGTTGETEISIAILDQWVEWMVAAGQEHTCAFDGWGTSV
jgi:hypothetical protein